jgi:HEAT repeat protein
MKLPASSLRIVLLFCILGIGLYLLYETRRRASLPVAMTQDAETTFAGADMSALTAGAIPDHLQALKEGDATARFKAAKALWQMGPTAKETMPTLLTVLKDPDGKVREMSAKALGTVSAGSLEPIPTLVAALRDPEASVRAAAAGALREIWVDAKGRPWAGKAHEAGEREERAGEGRREGREREAEREREGEPEAERRRPTIGEKEPSPAAVASMQSAVPALIKALHDPEAHVRANAAEALAETGKHGEPAVAALGDVLSKDADRDCRLQAALALGAIGSPARPAVPILLEHLRKDEEEGVRSNSGASLGLIHADPEKVAPALMEAYLRETQDDTRGVMMISLAHFGSDAKYALPTLEAAAADPKNQNDKARMQQINRALESIKANVKIVETKTPKETMKDTKNTK